MNRRHELRDVIFKEILAKGGIILDAAATPGGHQRVTCTIAGEPMKFIYSTTPSDSRAPKKARGYVRRRARAARKRIEQERRRQPNGRSQGTTI
jgi:hypothetical protein